MYYVSVISKETVFGYILYNKDSLFLYVHGQNWKYKLLSHVTLSFHGSLLLLLLHGRYLYWFPRTRNLQQQQRKGNSKKTVDDTSFKLKYRYCSHGKNNTVIWSYLYYIIDIWLNLSLSKNCNKYREWR